MRYKTENLVIRVTPEQRTVIAGAAGKCRESLSAFVRDAALSAAWRWMTAADDVPIDRPQAPQPPQAA